jgi:hypothetical protein
LTAGEHQVCGIRKNGTVACFSDSHFSARSNVDPDLLRPEVGWGHVSYLMSDDVRPLGAQRPIVGLASTGVDVCALEERGDVRCFGGPPLVSGSGPMWLAGQQQAEHKGTLDVFPAVPLSEPAKAVAIRTDRACAIVASGAVACWGRLGEHRTIRWDAPSGPP